MGVIGLIVAMVINIFIGSGMMMMIISMLGVLIFAGLTAYDTQNIKNNFTALQGVGGGIFSCTRIWVFARWIVAFAMWFGAMPGGLIWLVLVRFTRV